jgi:hypothetical protein
MQLSRRWLDWQPPQVSPVPHDGQLTKPTKPLASGPNTGAGERFVNSGSPFESCRNSLAHVQMPSPSAYAPDVSPPADMPPGVKLVCWEPLSAPVRLNRYLTVIDSNKFIRNTLRQLEARLTGDDWGAENWSLTELMARLEAVGVTVRLQDDRRWLQ